MILYETRKSLLIPGDSMWNYGLKVVFETKQNSLFDSNFVICKSINEVRQSAGNCQSNAWKIVEGKAFTELPMKSLQNDSESLVSSEKLAICKKYLKLQIFMCTHT